MIHICSKCDEEIIDGDWISLTVTTRYKRLGSKIAFALNTGDMVAETDSLCHSDCKGRNSGF